MPTDSSRPPSLAERKAQGRGAKCYTVVALSPRALAASLALVVPLLAGCAGNVGVSNVTDAFSYGGQVAEKTATESFTWHNTKSQAILSWGGQLAKGSIALTIQDAAGKTVYSKSMTDANNGFSGNTQSGLAGDWTVKLAFAGATANMGLSLAAQGGGYCPPGMGC